MIETCRWAVEAVRKEGNPFWVALLNRAEREGKSYTEMRYHANKLHRTR